MSHLLIIKLVPFYRFHSFLMCMHVFGSKLLKLIIDLLETFSCYVFADLGHIVQVLCLSHLQISFCSMVADFYLFFTVQCFQSVLQIDTQEDAK